MPTRADIAFDGLVQVLEEAVAATVKIVRERIFTRYSSPNKLFLLLILNNTARHASGTLALVSAQEYSGIPVLARSVFENYADYLNLLSYDDYPVFMQYLSIKGQSSAFQRLHDNPQSVYTKQLEYDLSQQMGTTLENALAELKEEKDKLEPLLSDRYRDSNGRVLTGVIKRCELANLVDVYDSHYRMLSTHAHGSTSAIAIGAIDGDEFVWPPNEYPKPYMSLDLIVETLLDESLRLGKEYRLIDSAPVEKLKLKRESIKFDFESGR